MITLSCIQQMMLAVIQMNQITSDQCDVYKTMSVLDDLNKVFGPALPETVIKPFMSIYQEPLNAKILKEKSAAYPRPANAKALKIPNLNSWLYGIVSEEQKEQDLDLQNVQSYMVASMSAVAIQAQKMNNLKQWAMSSINCNISDKAHLFAQSNESLMDANHFMSRAMYDTNQFRRKLIKQGMADSFIKILNDNGPNPEWLAGGHSRTAVSGVRQKSADLGILSKRSNNTAVLKSYEQDMIIGQLPQVQDSSDILRTANATCDTLPFASLDVRGMMNPASENKMAEPEACLTQSSEAEKTIKALTRKCKISKSKEFSDRFDEFMLESKKTPMKNSSEKNHTCQQCGQRMCSLGRLNIHMRIHTRGKPYICLNCSKGFSISDNLNRHLLIHHTEEKPHCCSVCSRGFSKSEEVIRHMTIHTIKPYKCCGYGKRVRQLRALKTHCRINREEKRNTFRQQGNIEKHLMVYSTEKPHICSVCGKGFGKVTALIKHNTIHDTAHAHKCLDSGRGFNTKLSDSTDTDTASKGYQTMSVTNQMKRICNIPVSVKEFKHCKGLVEHAETCSHIQDSRNIDLDSGEKSHVLENENINFVEQQLDSDVAVEYQPSNKDGSMTHICELNASCVSFIPEATSNEPHTYPQSTDQSIKCVDVSNILKSGKLFTEENSETTGRIYPTDNEESVPTTNKNMEPLYLCGNEHSSTKADAEKTSLISAPNDYNNSAMDERPHICSVCDKRFKLPGHLRDHSMLHTGERPYVCSQCGKGFITLSQRKVHMRIHTGETRTEKPTCAGSGKRFSTIGSLKTHMLLHTGEKPHKCSYCGNRFSRYDMLQVHLMAHAGEKPFECKDCSKRFTLASMLKIHIKTHLVDEHVCSKCSKRFRTLDHLMTHIIKHTDGIDDGSNKTADVVNGPHVCSQCGKEFKHAGHLRAHIRRHMAGKPNNVMATNAAEKPVCPDCDQTFSCFSALKNHFKTHSGEKPHVCAHCARAFRRHDTLRIHLMTHTGERPFTCKECGKGFRTSGMFKMHTRIHFAGNCPECNQRFTTLESLASHRMTHIKEKVNTTCSICSKSFSSAGSLKTHMRTHTGERSYLCPDCGKTFSAFNNLTVHMRLHTGERPHKCSYCSNTFNEPGQLTKHVRIHTGERPYVCSECGKGFRASTALTQHGRVHTGDTPYACPDCSMRFKTCGTLKRHQRTHTGNLPHACSECGKRFHSLWHVKEHMRTHTGEKPFVCGICTRKFSNSGTLKNHMTKTHSGERLRGISVV